MSGGVEKSSATMSCLCPPDCCSPEVEKDDGYVWFLIKVLFSCFLSFSHLLFIHFIANFLHTIIISFFSFVFFFFVKFLFKVLYGQWIVMGCLALAIIARQAKKPLHASQHFFWCNLLNFDQVDLLGGGAPLGLPDHLPAAPPQCPPRLWQPSPQGAQSAVRTRMRRRRTLKM